MNSSNESTLRIRWPKYWSFSFNISLSNEHSGLICRMDWLDLLAVQGTLKSLLQHHSSKASILWHSVFFTVQLSHPHITTGKTIGLTRWAFVGKAMSLLFNMLSRLYRSQQPVENSERDGTTKLSYLSPEKSLCGSRNNRTKHGTIDWFKIEKRVQQGYISSPCFLMCCLDWS